MKRIILITIIVCTILVGSAGACMAPPRPMLPMKPIWCQGTWTQQLQCDAWCNCQWVTVCLQ